MIFDEVVLHNFGLYQGRHPVRLTPPSSNKPIILIGGLNGGGKTTFLDAINLGLYGKRARPSNRGTLSYEEYLRRCINRGVSPSDGAAVEIQIRQNTEGEEHTYRVHRSWSAHSNGVTERTEVLCDGRYDRVLTESWGEVIEEFIPASMSHLFFFDGEKIEEFADLGNSTQLLSKAIHSLLGLDLVDRLSHDLVVLANRQRTSLKSAIERRQIEDAEKEVKRLNALRTETVEMRAAKQNELDRLEKRLRDCEARYEVEGGQLFEKRQSLTEERHEIERRLRDVEEELRAYAAGPAPLLLVHDLLFSAARQDRREEAAERAKGLKSLLLKRDKELLKEVKAQASPGKVLAFLEDFLAADRRQRAAAARVESYLHLSTEGRGLLQDVSRVTALSEVYAGGVRLVQFAEELQSQLADIDRKIAGIPDAGVLAPIVEELQVTQTAIQEIRVNLAALDIEIARITRERNQKKDEWLGQAEMELEEKLGHDDIQRILIHSQRVQQTLKKFRVAVVERHVRRIEQLVLDSFRQLLRKRSLISNLRINPERFSLELFANDGRVISPDRLSAGERQLLAVSMLWGLARASGRPLPVIIDTPLGRLDAVHRSNLIERYFPGASHQVLLLSTDEEINKTYYKKLKPWVGHTYYLDFDDVRGVTNVKPGYFW